MNPSLIAALITQVALPELAEWLHSRNGEPLTDEDVLAKLATDTQSGIEVFQAYKDAHGLTA